MKPMAVASQEEIKQLDILRSELKSVAQLQQQQLSQTMQNSMNMMQNIMGNKFQPNYQMPMNSVRPTYQMPPIPINSMNPMNPMSPMSTMSPTSPMNSMNPMNSVNPMNPIGPMNRMNPINQQQLQQQYNQQLLYQQLLQQRILQQLNKQYLDNQPPNYNRFAQNVPTTQPETNMQNNNNNLLPTTQYLPYLNPASRLNSSPYREPQIQADSNFQPSQQYYNNDVTNSLPQLPNQNQFHHSGNLLGQFNPAISATTAGGLGSSTGSLFGNVFPFGGVNSPFGHGFPFNGASTFAMAGR